MLTSFLAHFTPFFPIGSHVRHAFYAFNSNYDTIRPRLLPFTNEV